MLQLHLHLVTVVPERPVLVDNLEVPIHIQPTRRIDEYRPPDLVHTKVAAREIFHRLTVEWLLLKRHAYVVNIVLPAIRHVVSPHFLDLFEVKLPCAAESEQEDVIKPAIPVAHLAAAGLDPRLELLQHAILVLVQISEVARRLLRLFATKHQ